MSSCRYPTTLSLGDNATSRSQDRQFARSRIVVGMWKKDDAGAGKCSDEINARLRMTETTWGLATGSISGDFSWLEKVGRTL